MPILKSSSSGMPRQYTQKSRKGKKAWRKNIDSTDIEHGLEVLHEELIQGGVIREKSSQDLYTFDTLGNTSIPRKLGIEASKRLTADEIINQRSSIAAVSARKHPNNRVTNGIIEPKHKRISYVSQKEVDRLKAFALGKNDDLIRITQDASFDLWDDINNAKENIQDTRFSFLEKKKEKKPPITLKEKPISLAASGSEVSAVNKPNSAHSYNPSVTDYFERLEILGQKEIEAEKARISAAAIEHAKHEAVLKSAAEADEAEIRAQVSEWEEDSACERSGSSNEELKKQQNRTVRKTQAQRNKIKRRKEEERKLKMLLSIKKKNEQVSQVKKLASELDTKQSRRQLGTVNLREDFDKDDLLKLRRRKLGKIHLPEEDLELILPDELQDSLRLLKPEGNILKDRYRSLLVRGVLESRRPISFAKKPRRKVTEKWTHKDFVLH